MEKDLVRIMGGYSISIDYKQITGGTITGINTSLYGEKVTLQIVPDENFTYMGANILDRKNNVLRTLSPDVESFVSLYNEDIIISPIWKYNNIRVLYVNSVNSIVSWVPGKVDGADCSVKYSSYLKFEPSGYTRCDYWTNTLIDLTHVDYIHFGINPSSDTSGTVIARVSTDNTVWVHGSNSNRVDLTVAGDYYTMQLDVSDYNGSAYIGIQYLGSGTNLYIDNITLSGKTYQ